MYTLNWVQDIVRLIHWCITHTHWIYQCPVTKHMYMIQSLARIFFLVYVMYIVCIRINTSNMRYYFYFCYCKIRIYICLFFKTPSIFILKWKMSKTWYWFFCSQHIALKVYEPNVLAYREFIIIAWTLLVRYWVHVCVPSSVKLSLATPRRLRLIGSVNFRSVWFVCQSATIGEKGLQFV